MSFTLVIPGPPTGKGRPKFVKATGRAITPAKTRIAENRIFLAWQDAGAPKTGPVGAPLWLRVDIVLSRPQSHWRKDGTLSAAGQESIYPTKKPDLDNVVKLVADALNGCAWGDDAHIVSIECHKRWASPGEHEHTIVSAGQSYGPRLEAVRSAA